MVYNLIQGKDEQHYVRVFKWREILQQYAIIISMKRTVKEEMSEDGDSRDIGAMKGGIAEIDNILSQMQSTFKANLEAQERYIQIARCKSTINSSVIKDIYTLFTQNKANQICFQKACQMMNNFQWDERLLRRYYARVVEMGIKKISYYWMNSINLKFISPLIVKFMKQIYSCFNQIHKLKNLNMHFQLLKVLFQESSVIQQKIYQMLINDGYLMSMDQFYRINGVDLVGDALYEGKKSKVEISQTESEEQPQIKHQQRRNSKIQKVRRQTRRPWSQSKLYLQPINITTVQVQKNNTKIKTMMQSIVNVIKRSIQINEIKNKPIQVITQQNQNYQKTQLDIIQHDNNKNIYKKTKKNKNIKITNVIKQQSKQKKKIKSRRISIEIMNYFSNQFKSAFSQSQDVDIKHFSQLIASSQTSLKKKNLQVGDLGKKNNQFYIHSLKSLKLVKSEKKISEEQQRRQLIKIALHKKESEGVSKIYDDFKENSHTFNFIGHRDAVKINSQKFSLRSSPGIYITLPNRKDDDKGNNLKKSCKQQNNCKNRLVIRQNISKDQLFDCDFIVNQLISNQEDCLPTKINCMNVDGENFRRGVSNLCACHKKCCVVKTCPNQQLPQLYPLKEVNIENYQLGQNQVISYSNQQQNKTHYTERESSDSLLRAKYKNRSYLTSLKDEELRKMTDRKKQKNDFQMVGKVKNQNKDEKNNKYLYVVYDRVRRLIIMKR